MDLSQLLRALGLQQAYQSYQENIGQPFANVAGPFGRGLLGLEKPEYGEEQAYRTGQAVGNMPAVSAPVGAFKAATQVPGLLADASQAMKGLDLAGLLGLTAYHGSPYRFSKFDPTKIGSGEGAQAYGYGMYFAENPKVAEEYRMMLSPHTRIGDAAFDLANYSLRVKPSIADAIEYLIKEKNSYDKRRIPSSDYLQQYDDAIKILKEGKGIRPGSFYTVDIPDEMIGRMLDWDKPLSQQPKVLASIKNLPEVKTLMSRGQKFDELTGQEFYRLISDSRSGGYRDASAGLKETGIPGIRYFDEGSRASGQGTRNFVVFPGEEEAIKMLKVE